MMLSVELQRNESNCCFWSDIGHSRRVCAMLVAANAVRGIQQGEEFHAFAKVISTVPRPFVPRLMPDLPHEILKKFQGTKNIAVVCVIAKLKKPVTDNFWLNTDDPEMDIPGLVEYSNLRPLEQHIVYLPFYIPADHPKFAEADSAFLDKVNRYLRKINPTLVEDDFIELRASRYRHAQPICEPGHLHRLTPVALPVEGLWVAETSYHCPEDRGLSESIEFGRMMARLATA